MDGEGESSKKTSPCDLVSCWLGKGGVSELESSLY